VPVESSRPVAGLESPWSSDSIGLATLVPLTWSPSPARITMAAVSPTTAIIATASSARRWL
jgi:hypothetical protein